MFRKHAFVSTAVALSATVFLLPAACLAGRPLPPESALNSAKKLVIDTFRKELSASDKTPAVLVMLETADKTEGDADKAALYLSAADVAARAGETKLAFEALEKLAHAFDVDLLGIKLVVLESAAKEAKTPEARLSAANVGLELADDAVNASRFDVAESALKTAAAASSKIRDAELRKAIASKRRDVEKAKRQHDQIEAAIAGAQKTLKEKPDDPEANETLGKHLAFDRNDWRAGLKHLAKAADSDLQKVALADQSGASEPNQSTTLGDWWWALGESAENARDKAGYQSRAVFWYTRAVASLTGLQKTRVEKRLKDAGDAALTAAASQTGGDNGKFIDITLAPGVVMRLVKIPASKDGKIKEFYLGQTEVTQKQWVAVMGSNPSSVKKDSLPVTNVSFDMARAFCDQIAHRSPTMIVRLPSPEERHHAQALAFSGISTARLNEFAWLKSDSNGSPHSIASKAVDLLGLSDMIGNVAEWCSEDGRVYGGFFGDGQVLSPDDASRWYASIPPGTTGVICGIRVSAVSQ